MPSSFKYRLKEILRQKPYQTVVLLYVAFVMVNGLVLVVYERNSSLSHIQSVYNGIWTTAITQNTVGYGDFVPSTDLGRILSVLAASAAILTNSLVLTISLRKLKLTVEEAKFLAAVKGRKHLPTEEVVILLQRWIRLKQARKAGFCKRFPLLLRYMLAVEDFKVRRRRVFQHDSQELDQVIHAASLKMHAILNEAISRYRFLQQYKGTLDDISTKQVQITSKILILRRRLMLLNERDRSPRIHRCNRKGMSFSTSAKRKMASDLAYRHMIEHRFGSKRYSEAQRPSVQLYSGR